MTATLTAPDTIAREQPTHLKDATIPSSVATLTVEEQRRLCEEIPDHVEHVCHESFALPETQERLLGEDAEKLDVPLWSSPTDPAAAIRLAKMTRLTPEQETMLFLQYNYARYRLSHLLAAPRARSSVKSAREILEWHALAMKTRSNLVRANLALVYAMVKRTRVAGVEVNELVSEGNMALLRSIEKFDVSRGAKFSTYACRSILKGFGRLAKRIQQRRNRLMIEYSANMDFHDSGAAKHERRWKESLETLREILTENLARLSKVEQIIVTERFALKTGGKARTLAQVAKIVGLTDERVRQLQILALAKIRAALDKNLLRGGRSTPGP